MKISFKAHQATDRELELSQQELFQLFEIMREEFKTHITYGRFSDVYQTTKGEKSVAEYCESHGVDVAYDKDRIAFFTAILDDMKNPYQ
jgi:hypothetical protein